jgi:hypothetical protein
VTLRVQILKDKFAKSLGLPFKELLPSSVIGQALSELKIKYYQRLFDPFVTLWAFLSQVLDTDKTCHNAVSKIIAYLAEEGVEVPSTDTSGYCQARARLPEKLLEKLFGKAAQSLEEKVTTEHLWCGRSVKVIDGSTVSMPDTAENQKAYPQPKSQKPGCGFPIAKIGVIFSLATGAAVALVIDVLNTHDLKLARQLYQFLNPLDILLGDRAFCALKTTLGMDVLRCKTPSMVRKEIYVYLLAYNLLRSLMWSAGTTYGTPPNRLSLQGTRHHLINFIPQLLTGSDAKRQQIYRTLLKVVAHKAVSDRPARNEPRVRKRRPKAYPLMTKPRNELRKQLQTA